MKTGYKMYGKGEMSCSTITRKGSANTLPL